MAFCPADCASDTLTPNPTTECEIKVRKRSIDRIGFYSCVTDLPAPFTCVALQGLVDANQLVFSSPLANIEVGDPTFEELQVADCLPPDRVATSRTISFQDRISLELTGNEVSPAVPKNPFFDYDFWKDKKTKKATLRYMLIFCDGSVVVPRDENGRPMEANLDVFLSYERQGSGGTSYTLEIKKGQLQFKGDPLDLANTPELDGSNEVFNIKDCAGMM